MELLAVVLEQEENVTVLVLALCGFDVDVGSGRAYLQRRRRSATRSADGCRMPDRTVDTSDATAQPARIACVLGMRGELNVLPFFEKVPSRWCVGLRRCNFSP